MLIGIAPTGGRLPDDWRATILAAIRSGLDVLSGLHTFLGDDPEFAEAARCSGVRIDRLPPPAGADGDLRRPPPRPGQAGDPHRRHRLRHRQDVASPWSCGAAATAAGRDATFVATGQTGMMIEGWGVAIDRVISDFVQGTGEWLAEEGERARRLGHRRGPGIARPPGVPRGHARADPRVHAPRDGDGPQAGPRRPRLRPRARPAASRSRRCRRSSALHEAVAGLVAPSKVVAIALNTSLYADEADARRIVAATAARDRAAGAPTRCASAATGCGARSRPAVDALPWVTLPTSRPRPDDADAPAPDARAAAPRPVRHRPGVARRGPVGHDRHRELRDDADGPDGPIGLGEGYPDTYYGETPATMAAVAPLLLDALGPIAADLRGSLDDVRAALEDADGPDDRGDRPPRRDQVRDRHRAPRPRRQAPRRCRSGGCSGMTATLPPTDFTLGLDEPSVVAERAPPRGRLPGAQDQGRRRSRHRDARGGARGLRGPDPRGRQHRLEPDEGDRHPARPAAPGRGADRAAVPGRPARPAALAPGAVGAADRRRRERRHHRGPGRASSGSSPAST